MCYAKYYELSDVEFVDSLVENIDNHPACTILRDRFEDSEYFGKDVYLRLIGDFWLIEIGNKMVEDKDKNLFYFNKMQWFRAYDVVEDFVKRI